MKGLLIGSTVASGGKSATVLGLGRQLQGLGLRLGYGKPVGTAWERQGQAIVDPDVELVSRVLGLTPAQITPTLVFTSDYARQQRFLGRDTHDYLAQLAAAAPQGGLDLWLLEGPDDLTAGRLFQLSLTEMATTLDVPVLLVGAYQDGSLGDTLLDAQDRLGHRLLGVLLNAVPEGVFGEVQATLVPFLERQGIPVFGVLPQSRLLRCVSVRNLVQALQAEVVCGADRLDLLVEELSIGAMNVSAALEYLRRGVNMVVVTGSDRVDIQLAALETSTHCLVLTGHAQPTSLILERAQELEVPILAVDMDTLAAVAAIEETFAQVRLREPLKVAGVQDLFGEHVDSQQLLNSLGLGRPVSVG